MSMTAAASTGRAQDASRPARTAQITPEKDLCLVALHAQYLAPLREEHDAGDDGVRAELFAAAAGPARETVGEVLARCFGGATLEALLWEFEHLEDIDPSRPLEVECGERLSDSELYLRLLVVPADPHDTEELARRQPRDTWGQRGRLAFEYALEALAPWEAQGGVPSVWLNAPRRRADSTALKEVQVREGSPCSC
jgi:hypothetical protein